MAIHLYLDGVGADAHVVVAVEASPSRWVEVIRERADGCYSHFVEPAGIQARIDAHDRKHIADLIKRSSIGEALDDIKARGIDAHTETLTEELKLLPASMGGTKKP